MDLLNSIALPHSIEHFHLLLFIFNMLCLMFVPYFALLLGATFFGVMNDRRGRNEESSDRLRLADDMLGCAIPTKSVFTFFALLPAIALVFVFIQLLQGTSGVAAGVMALGNLCLVAGGIALYVFRFTGTMKIVPVEPGESLVSPLHADMQSSQARDLSSTHRKAGSLAVAALVATAFLFAGSFSIALDPGMWGSGSGLLGTFVSAHTWVRFFGWMTLAAGMTGAMLLFYAFSWNGGQAHVRDSYDPLLKKFALRLLTISLLLQPLLVVVEILLQPPKTLSGGVFLLGGGALLFFFATLHFVYAFAKVMRPAYAAYALFSLLVAIGMSVTKDQVTLHHATDDRAALLAHTYEIESAKLAATLGVSGPVQTGEDIYNAKCSACHNFDVKKVGPPYNVVVQKYAGKKSSLIGFILNPIKVDPAYPPMPGQGLRPAEADSIATYLLKKTGVSGS